MKSGRGKGVEIGSEKKAQRRGRWTSKKAGESWRLKGENRIEIVRAETGRGIVPNGNE